MSKIVFFPEPHIYKNIETDEQYLSVTTLIGKYTPKFDTEKWANIKAKQAGCTPDEIKKQWDETRNYACDRGTSFHEAMENFLKFGEINPNYEKVISYFGTCVEKIIENISTVQSELLLYNDEYKIAGTADIIWEHEDGTFTVGDFKTNKKFNYYSSYNEWMLNPISHLSECQYNKYAIQLSIYAYMYELMTGKKCRGMVLFYLNQNTGKLTPIFCNYLKHEVMLLLRDYKKNTIK